MRDDEGQTRLDLLNEIDFQRDCRRRLSEALTEIYAARGEDELIAKVMESIDKDLW